MRSTRSGRRQTECRFGRIQCEKAIQRYEGCWCLELSWNFTLLLGLSKMEAVHMNCAKPLPFLPVQHSSFTVRNGKGLAHSVHTHESWFMPNLYHFFQSSTIALLSEMEKVWYIPCTHMDRAKSKTFWCFRRAILLMGSEVEKIGQDPTRIRYFSCTVVLNKFGFGK